jgi:uncharacterized protein (TIGR02453 family)
VTDRAYFGPGLLRFLKDLRLHNERKWFLANQQRYENDVPGPFLQLIADLAPGLKKISPNFIVDPRPNKGSLMRIYRDIRFSKDKSPYKTCAARASGRPMAKTGPLRHFLHLEPGNSENEPEPSARQRASCLPRPPWPPQHRALFL